MRKMIFNNMSDMKKMIDIFEKNNLEYSWYFLDKKYEMHLGDTNVDHVKWMLRENNIQIPFRWGNYYW